MPAIFFFADEHLYGVFVTIYKTIYEGFAHENLPIRRVGKDQARLSRHTFLGIKTCCWNGDDGSI